VDWILLIQYIRMNSGALLRTRYELQGSVKEAKEYRVIVNYCLAFHDL
jgi:hypothetical protein